MITAVREKFGPENDAKDCETAVSSLSSQITDKKVYREMVPSGLKVDGEGTRTPELRLGLRLFLRWPVRLPI